MSGQHKIIRPNDREIFRGQWFLGTAVLLMGSGLLFLAIVDASTGLPFPMPRFWYVNRPLWCFFAVFLFVVGCLVLRQRFRDAETWSPSQPGIRFGRVVLYTRPGCGLCDRARQTLLKHADHLPEIEEVDVGGDPEMAERFAESVPLVEIDGRVRLQGRVNDRLLRRLIEETPPKA